MVWLNEPEFGAILKVAQRVNTGENLDISTEGLKQIVTNCRGNTRAMFCEIQISMPYLKKFNTYTSMPNNKSSSTSLMDKFNSPSLMDKSSPASIVDKSSLPDVMNKSNDKLLSKLFNNSSDFNDHSSISKFDLIYNAMSKSKSIKIDKAIDYYARLEPDIGAFVFENYLNGVTEDDIMMTDSDVMESRDSKYFNVSSDMNVDISDDSNSYTNENGDKGDDKRDNKGDNKGEDNNYTNDSDDKNSDDKNKPRKRIQDVQDYYKSIKSFMPTIENLVDNISTIDANIKIGENNDLYSNLLAATSLYFLPTWNPSSTGSKDKKKIEMPKFINKNRLELTSIVESILSPIEIMNSSTLVRKIEYANFKCRCYPHLLKRLNKREGCFG